MKIKLLLSFAIISLFITHPVNASVTWASHTVIVSQDILDALDTAITASPPDPAAVYYAITNVSTVGGYYVVSIAGLSSAANPSDWTMAEAVWLGNAVLSLDYLTVAIEGSLNYETITSGTIFDSGGGVSDNPVFPWMPGKKAFYGTRGVHAAGYGLNSDDWFAVDFVSGPTYGSDYFPNSIYGAIDSEITYICRDDTSVAVRAGDYLYSHLADNASLDYGFNIRKGVQFASLATGSFTDTCGWASQFDTSYHVHFGIYAPSGKKDFEGWVIDSETQVWTKGNQTIEIGGSLLSTGVSSEYGSGESGDPLTALDGQHFWDAPINSIINLTANRVVTIFPEKQTINLAASYYNAAAVAIRIFYILLKSNFNLGVFIFVTILMLILEQVRLVYGTYRMVKDSIPFL